jgi:heme ABC exporter ATP-binding subunit CcmA
MAPAISLRSAVAVAGTYPVLSGVDLDLEHGQVCVVLGANGAGKTSLLRLLSGLTPLTTGTAQVLDCVLPEESPALRRQVGLLGHDVGLWDDLYPAENLRFALRAARQDPSRAEEALERVGIAGRTAKTPLGVLSEGQRRRVGLALLIARRPQLWLLDEPHAGLDAPTRLLLNELVEAAAHGGATVVATSHEPELSVPMADVVLTMRGGAVIEQRTGGRQRPRGISDVA